LISSIPQVNIKSKILESQLTLTPEQCRIGRALLGWTQTDLAKRSGVTKPTIAAFETGARQPYVRTLDDLRRALEKGDEKGGAVFIGDGEPSLSGGAGVRRESPKPHGA
jgi:transcriptional regulator with XRE-family HTH domain